MRSIWARSPRTTRSGRSWPAAAEAGIDLFLCGADRAKVERIEAALAAAAVDGSIPAASNAASLARVVALRSWLASRAAQPGLEVVGGAEHRRLEAEVAARALTLVRDPSGRLPLGVDRDATIVAIMPTPTDLTPADTSSTIEPGLARALRAAGRRVDEVVIPAAPTSSDISAARARVARPGVAVAIVGTIDARHFAGQADLVRAVAETGVPTVAVALRTPWDVTTYPASVTAVCTYSIHGRRWTHWPAPFGELGRRSGLAGSPPGASQRLPDDGVRRVATDVARRPPEERNGRSVAAVPPPVDSQTLFPDRREHGSAALRVCAAIHPRRCGRRRAGDQP